MQLIWHLYAPDTILSVQDTLQTLPRHLPDTLQTPQNMARFDQSEATGRKGKDNIDESNWMVINCLHIISPQAVSRVTQTTWVSGRCLGGVWRVSCTLKIVSGAYKCQINCNKSCRYHQLSVFHFLPVAYFGFWLCCPLQYSRIQVPDLPDMLQLFRKLF